jgi:hypothetical protein
MRRSFPSQPTRPVQLPVLKQCPGCGAVHTHTEWCRLPFVGHQPDYEGGLLELRNCTCESTIAIQVVA